MGARALPLRRDGAARVILACPDTPRGLRDIALVTVMREGMLRAAEAAALTWRDILPETDGTAVVSIRRSKTNPHGLRVESVTVSQLCVGRLLAWQRHAPRGPVFGLSPRSVAEVVRRAGERAGIEGLSGHSCRRGAAQDMARDGCTAPQLMARGRWQRMDSAQRYIAEVVAELGREVPPSVIV